MSRDALIVGINSYQYLKPLSAPALDAEAIAQRLEKDGDFDQVRRLPEVISETEPKVSAVSGDCPLSCSELEQALEELFQPGSSQAPDTVLFYFSGHGLEDTQGFDKGYLAASDTNPNMSRSGLSLRWLQWLLSESPVKQQIVWLDCCHSGSLMINVGAANPVNSQSRDRCFIASSRDFESSWEDLNSSYSVLTKALLEGLEPSRLPGRWIDTFALVDYINQALKGELQTPVCTNFGEAIKLTRSWQVEDQSVDTSQSDSGICPYKGLEFFDCNDEDPKYFFGREQLVDELLNHVRTTNFLALVGASGNGKSSVLRAGLLHQLKLGRRIAGSDQWRIRITRPESQPMQNLALSFVEDDLTDLDRAEALGRASGLLNEGAEGLKRLVQASTAPRVILVIDQFEEVFTCAKNLEDREQFFECLTGALSESDDKLCLIIAMRADFIGKCFEHQYSGLGQWIQRYMISVLPMRKEELQAAMCKPAEQVGLSIEPSLVTQILNDIQGAPGSLPLLQYTLKALWQERQENQLVLEAYQAVGGINGSLDKRASEIYNRFEAEEQLTVQHIFQQLTQLGEGTDDTRRRVFQTDLVAEPKHPVERVQKVIKHLSNPDNRLLVTSEVVSKSEQSARMAIVDVAHEALIRHWKLLRQWIEKNRDLLRRQRQIDTSAVIWREQGKRTGDLLQGLPLVEALNFNKQHSEDFPLSESAKGFIQKSLKQRRLNLLKTASWLVIPALIILGVVEYRLREDGIQADYDRLDEKGSIERRAVADLVEGCREKRFFSWVPPYFTERLFGNCRSLYEAPLGEANLRSADLRSAYLSNADLRSADLRSADLRYADLSNADLRNADLIDADLRNADLRSAYLSNADLSNADLRYADLSYADLIDADLRYAYLRYADLIAVRRPPLLPTSIYSSADLRSADLRSADLRSADLRYADLRKADLIDADLRSADLRSADLRSADLRNADLIDADLIDADLIDADLSNAIMLNNNLRETKNLKQEQLEGDKPPFLCHTLLPKHIQVSRDRDCDRLAKYLVDRSIFDTEEGAKRFIEEERKKTWEDN